MHNIVLEERAETPSPASSQPTAEHRTRLQSSLHFLSLASMEIVVKRTFPFFLSIAPGKIIKQTPSISIFSLAPLRLRDENEYVC